MLGQHAVHLAARQRCHLATLQSPPNYRDDADRNVAQVSKQVQRKRLANLDPNEYF